MSNCTRYLGLDVHAETITAAIAEGRGRIRSLGKFPKGRLTRTGNAHLRHVLGEAAWHARHRPWLNLRMKKILPTLPAGVAEIAWKAQERLHRKFTRMTYCRKPAGKVAAAVARELVGFIWAIGTLVASQQIANNKARAA
jgi:transposase